MLGSRRGERRREGVIDSEHGESGLKGMMMIIESAYILAASVYTTPWKADENKSSPYPGFYFVRRIQ